MSKTDTADGFKITIPYKLSDEDVRNLLISAFEGGSNSWYMIERHDYGKRGKKVLDTAIDKALLAEYNGMAHYLLPFIPGCGIVISAAIDGSNLKEYTLNRTALKRGLSNMAKKFPAHFKDLIEENGDAITGDVFLQCALFGEVVFG